MKVEEFIEYIEIRLNTAELKLSEFGKSEIIKRWKEKPNNGGYSDYWKEIELSSVMEKINANV